MKVLLLTQNQLNKVEFILNRFLGRYFYVSDEQTDENEDITSVIVDHRYIAKEVGGKYVINASKLKRLWQQLTPTQKAKIKARFSNVDLRQWIDNNMVDFESVTIPQEEL